MAANGILASMSVVLSGEISGFQRAMAQARRELAGFVKAGEMLKGIGENLTTYLSAPLALAGVASLKAGADFETGMNRVQAATLASGAELESLKEKAKSIALDPRLKFSAQDAAGALEALATNGLDTTDILGGAADAAVNLSTATGGQLAGAANIATDIMQNFGKQAGELADVVDKVTGATIASKFKIEDYAGALAQAGGAVGPLGVSFEDFNTAIAATATGFSSGSDAGTSFKTFIQRLVPQSKEAAAAMEKLGLKFFDAQGKMKPLREIAGELQRAFKGLSDQQRTDLGTQIFGADSIRTALLLAKQGTEGFDQMAQSIGKVKAAQQGEILSQGFAGSLEGFKSSLEGLGIAIADSGLLDFGGKFLRMGSDIASSLAQASPEVLGFSVVVAGLAASIGPLSLAIGGVMTTLPALKLGFNTLSSGLTSLLSPTTLVVAGLAALAAGIYYVSTASERAVDSFEQQSKATQSLTSSVNPLLDRYEALKSKTTLTAAEQEELRGIVEKIAQQVPAAITAVDQYGKAMDISADKTREFAGAQRELEKQLAIKALPDAEAKLRDFGKRLDGLRKQQQEFNKTGGLATVEFDSRGLASTTQVYKAGSEQVRKLQLDLATLNVEYLKQQELVGRLQAAAGKFGEVNPEFAKYGRLAREAGDYIRSFAQAAEDAAGKGGPALTDDQVKALEKLREELRQNELRFAALGSQYDVVGNKQKILQSGIESLISVGFKPLGKTVQGFVGQLLQIPAAVDQIETPLTEFLDRMNKAAEKQQQKDFNPFSKLDLTALPELPALPAFDTTALSASVTATIAELTRLRDAQLVAETFTDGMNQALVSGLQNVAVGFGEAIGQIVSGAAGLDALPVAVLGAVGGMAVQLGQLAIGTGIAVAGIKASLESLNPALAIAGGIALVALGSAVKGAASRIGKSRGPGSSATPIGGAPTPVSRPVEAQKLKIEIQMQPVTIRQDGPSLRGVLSVDKYRQVYE